MNAVSRRQINTNRKLKWPTTKTITNENKMNAQFPISRRQTKKTKAARRLRLEFELARQGFER